MLLLVLQVQLVQMGLEVRTALRHLAIQWDLGGLYRLGDLLDQKTLVIQVSLVILEIQLVQNFQKTQ